MVLCSSKIILILHKNTVKESVLCKIFTLKSICFQLKLSYENLRDYDFMFIQNNINFTKKIRLKSDFYVKYSLKNPSFFN